ncbi:SDR family oxidoreductase [Pseudomonas aeruginosa]
MGYVRSKWVMEKIADLAAERGLPLMTFRLGYATAATAGTGAYADYQWWRPAGADLPGVPGRAAPARVARGPDHGGLHGRGDQRHRPPAFGAGQEIQPGAEHSALPDPGRVLRPSRATRRASPSADAVRRLGKSLGRQSRRPALSPAEHVPRQHVRRPQHRRVVPGHLSLGLHQRRGTPARERRCASRSSTTACSTCTSPAWAAAPCGKVEAAAAGRRGGYPQRDALGYPVRFIARRTSCTTF